MKPKRKVHIGTEVWEYRLGKGSAVIFHPNGYKTVVDYSQLTGKSWDDIERGHWKKYFSVTPRDVAAYIEAHLYG